MFMVFQLGDTHLSSMSRCCSHSLFFVVTWHGQGWSVGTVASWHWQARSRCTWQAWLKMVLHGPQAYQSPTSISTTAASIHVHSEDSCIWLRFHICTPHTASTCHSETHMGSLFKSYFTSLWHSPSSTMQIYSWLAFLTPPCRYIANPCVISPCFVS